ncbi:MAG: FliH/SctL family protein [Planctomycetota bacterium]
MPIVKQTNAKPLIREAVVLDLGDLGRQAARLREAAEAKARAILEDARAEAARITAGAEKVGYEKGHAEGLVEGTEAGRAAGHAEALAAGAERVEQTTAAFDEVAAAWAEHRAAMHREAREAVLRFAVKFAQRVTHRVVEVDPAVAADQVASALSSVLEPTDVRLKVHPDDRASVAEVLPDLLAGLNHLRDVELVDDAEVGRGGCVLCLRGGEVDASIDTQVRRLTELLLPGGGEEMSS